jgi:hypothetical protein
MLHSDAQDNTPRIFQADCNFVAQFGRPQFA